MIPNVLNTILGIALVYCAILAPDLMNATASLPAAGVGIIALGLWARPSDKIKWFSLVNTILGAALVLLGIGRTLTTVHPLVMFWWVFWVGIIVAVLACWSALYARDASATTSDQR
jgi:hypothetical protein